MTQTTTRRRASIIHGYNAQPSDHWFAWLAHRLATDGVTATVPALPSSHDPDPDQWHEAIGKAVEPVGQDLMIIAHSLGCLSVLRYLGSLPEQWRLGALVLVSGFTDPLPALPELDAFIGQGCDVTGLAPHIDHVAVIGSDNDPLVPPSHTDRLAAALGTRTHVIGNGGHFLASDGFTSLPAAYDALAL